MRSEDFIKSQIALLAWREGHRHGLNNMLAIAYMLRNRQRAGWGDWLTVIKNYDLYRGTKVEPTLDLEYPDLGDRDFLQLLRAVDDIYSGVAVDNLTTNHENQPGLYCGELHNVTRDWFLEKIVRSPEHKPTTVVNGVTFFT